MAPERPAAGPGRAHAPRALPRNHQTDVGAWPLPARLVRQIQRQVARSGRSLQRLEVRGAVIDNFDALGPPSPPSPPTPPSPPEPHSPPAHYRTPHFCSSSDTYEDESMGADGAAVGAEGPGEDNDLTSLSWLQDRNLLRSINLTKGENDELRPISVQISPQSGVSGASPTSDYLEESFTSEPADSSGSDQPAPSPPSTPQPHRPNSSASKLKHPHNVPYNPLVHTQNKPPYSFSCLIFMAIEDSPGKALPVKEIYSWIVAHFPYFRSAPTGWKNSVRHNLSLNKCFQKVEKAPSLGKGSLWMVDDQYRSNLLQAFSRSPFHPCVPPTPPAAPAPVTAPHPPPAQDRLPPTVEAGGVKGAPNPQLFPFLARRLAASTGRPTPDPPADMSGHESSDSLDEVVAAAMVLALKHGPGVLPPPLISSCPTQDHTYSAPTGSPEAGYGSDEEQRKTAEALLHLAGVPPCPQSPPSQGSGHRPRLLRRAPKRPPAVAGLEAGGAGAAASNNNRNGQADRNLKAKRPRPLHL